MVWPPSLSPSVSEVGDEDGRRISVSGGPRRREDAAFIATAHDMAALIAAQAAEIERLRGAVTLAANRLDVAVVNAIADGQHGMSDISREWAMEARAALERTKP
jgi:hypothetical protein